MRIETNFKSISYCRTVAAIIGWILFSGLCISANASTFQLNSETILGVFEREDPDSQSLQVIPLYEYMQLDLGDVETQPLSLHLHGWVRSDLGDGGYYEDDSDGELLYGYVEYAPPEGSANVKLGRQHVYSGVINDSLDGIGVAFPLGPYISVSACGGYPVAYQEGNGSSGDGIYGGRAALHLSPSNEIGVSYKNISDDTDTVENSAGVDVSLSLTQNWTVDGLSVRNLETDNWKSHVYQTWITVYPFSIKPFYQRYAFEDYFDPEAPGVQPFRYLQGTDEKLTIVGSDVIWQAFSRADLGARFKHYDYDLRAETSRYAAVLMNLYGSGDTLSGVEAGVMDGDADQNKYGLLRGYFFWDTPLSFVENWFISGDVVYAHYRQEIYGRDHSLFISMGTGKKIGGENFLAELSGSYSEDPYFDADFRMMLVLKFTLK